MAASNGFVRRTILSSFEPTLTFATPGDLNVVHGASTRGAYYRFGNLVYIHVKISASTFTHSTASGRLYVNGLPYTAYDSGGVASNGDAFMSGTIGGCTVDNAVAFVQDDTDRLEFEAVISGTRTSLDTTHFISGASVSMEVSGVYLTEDPL
jgi:hypothetical protein